MIILIFFSIILVLLFIIYQSNSDECIYKVVDESCYYCVYSITPHSIRDKNKNTCKKINNQYWNSEQIRDCKYRVKK